MRLNLCSILSDTEPLKFVVSRNLLVLVKRLSRKLPCKVRVTSHVIDVNVECYFQWIAVFIARVGASQAVACAPSVKTNSSFSCSALPMTSHFRSTYSRISSTYTRLLRKVHVNHRNAVLHDLSKKLQANFIVEDVR